MKYLVVYEAQDFLPDVAEVEAPDKVAAAVRVERDYRARAVLRVEAASR